jgi:hypothetical protein
VVEFSAFFTYAKIWFGIVLSAGSWVRFGVVSRTSAKAGSSDRGSRWLEDLLRCLESGLGLSRHGQGGLLEFLSGRFISVGFLSVYEQAKDALHIRRGGLG